VLSTRQERSIELELLPTKNAQELAANYQSVAAAVGEGRITPGEAQSLTEVLDRQARVFELVDMERRIQELEDYKSEFQACRSQLRKEVLGFAGANEKEA